MQAFNAQKEKGLLGKLCQFQMFPGSKPVKTGLRTTRVEPGTGVEIRYLLANLPFLVAAALSKAHKNLSDFRLTT